MIRFAANAKQCIVNGKKKNTIVPSSPWDFVTLPEEKRATAICMVHRKIIGKDREYGSGDMLADRQTDTPTDTDTNVLITVLKLS